MRDRNFSCGGFSSTFTSATLFLQRRNDLKCVSSFRGLISIWWLRQRLNSFSLVSFPDLSAARLVFYSSPRCVILSKWSFRARSWLFQQGANILLTPHIFRQFALMESLHIFSQYRSKCLFSFCWPYFLICHDSIL